MTRRYQARSGSQLGHGCCFDATVVDTTRPVIVGEGTPTEQQYVRNGEPMFEVFCECADMQDAERIADALNAKEAS